MFSRLKDGALKLELESGHGAFISCPEKLASMMLAVSEMQSLQFRPLCQLCEVEWQEQEEKDELGVHIEILGAEQTHNQEEIASNAASSQVTNLSSNQEGTGENQLHQSRSAQEPAPKRQHVPEKPPSAMRSLQVAYRISKSRRDSTMVKVLNFPSGVVVGAPAFYWYESFVDDPAQYTNSSLNVPERGHEESLDVAGISRNLCAEGSVTALDCSRVAFSWDVVVTKVPGQAWEVAECLRQAVWGIDGREWNGSFASSAPGVYFENLTKYTKGTVDAFWEDVPKKATNLLAAVKAESTAAAIV
eukprot:TRINITY_DN19428_c0_g1_i1.p1 TRINITY_DN19428_c0_g1~~TRINITY_DN19428_c0_g1_i1.p1  ORF type:complete len:348 (+),score=69.26 TRINITY_DN19428_c0_g1_i1:137-1045(+)